MGVRRCLRDDRGLLFIVEAGRVMPTIDFYTGDPAMEWGKNIEKVGFNHIRYMDSVYESGKEYSVHQWVFETAPVDPEVNLDNFPLLAGKEWHMLQMGYGASKKRKKRRRPDWARKGPEVQDTPGLREVPEQA